MVNDRTQTDQNQNMKIIIEVESGCVTGVYCSQPAEVEIRDRDAEEKGDKWQTVTEAESLEASPSTH